MWVFKLGKAKEFLVVWALVVGCVGRGAQPSLLRPPPTPPLQHQVFENGMRVVAEQVPDFGVSGVVLLVGSGSAVEAEGQAGVAHLTEHLVFRARHGSGATLWNRLGSIGAGSFNGSTSWDATEYHAVVPSSSLEALLKLYVDVLAAPLDGVDDVEFRHELEVVRAELRLRNENGRDGQALNWLSSSAFPDGDVYAHPVSGTHESLDGLTLDAVRAFAEQHYKPNNATLVVSTPLPAAQADALIRSVLRSRASITVEAERVPEPKPAKRALLSKRSPLETLRAPVVSPTLFVGWSVPSAYRAEGDPLPLLTRIVDGAFWSNLTTRHPDILTFDAGYASGARASLLYAKVTLDRGDDPEAVKASVIRHIQKGLSERIHDPRWFAIYRDGAVTGDTYALEHVVSRALSLAASSHFNGDALFLASRPNRVARMTDDTIAQFYERYVTEERAHAVLLRPVQGEAPSSVPTGLGTPRDEGERSSGRTPLPDPKTIRSWMKALSAAHVETKTLPNGLTVRVLSRRGATYHTALLGFHGGSAYGGHPGAAMASLWASYSFSLPASSSGLHHITQLDADETVDVVRGTGSDLGPTLAQLKNSLDFELRWPTPQFTSQVEAYEREEQSPRGRLQRLVHRAVFGNHPYAAETTAREMRALSATEVHAFTRAVRRPENAVLVLVGDFDPGLAFRTAERELGSWRSPGAAREALAAPAPLANVGGGDGVELLLEHQPGSSQVELSFACILPPASELAAKLLFATAFDETLSGQLRTDLSASYGVGHNLTFYRGGTTLLSFYADLAYPSLEEALGELRAFTDGEQVRAAKSIDAARASVARLYNLAQDTTAGVAGELFRSWNLDRPVHSLGALPDAILSTPATDVEAVARHCQNNSVLALLGDEARLRTATQRVFAEE